MMTTLVFGSFFHRFRDRNGSPGPDASLPPLFEEPHRQDSLSRRSENQPRSAPVDPHAVEFFMEQSTGLKAASGDKGRFDAVLQTSLEAVCNEIGAERVTLFVMKSGSAELDSAMGAGAGSETAVTLPSGRGLAGDVLRYGTPFVVNDSAENALQHAALEEVMGYRILNIFAAPLKDSLGETYGVFQIVNKPGGFTLSDQALLLPYVSAVADTLHPHL